MDKTPTPRRNDDTAPWRGDLLTFWVLLFEFVVLTVAVAVIIELVRGFIGWVLMALVLVICWLIPVLILVPRTVQESARSERAEGE